MNYSQEREEFIADMTKRGLPLAIIRTVLAKANTVQRNAELSCSSEAADRDRVPCPAVRKVGSVRVGKEEDCCCDQGFCICGHSISSHPMQLQGKCDLCDCQRFDGAHGTVPRIDRQTSRIERALKNLLEPRGYKVSVYGDPRGCALHLTNGDGREIGVPAKGLPASFWERNR